MSAEVDDHRVRLLSVPDEALQGIQDGCPRGVGAEAGLHAEPAALQLFGHRVDIVASAGEPESLGADEQGRLPHSAPSSPARQFRLTRY